MRPLTRYSEPYTATGGLAAEGVLNQLGRPDIEPLEVLIREAVQNCWDAKRPSESAIRVVVGRKQLEGEALQALRQIVLPDPPPDIPLAEWLGERVELLYFADFGTAGLGGPTRADVSSAEVPRDFVDFVRNIGQPPDKELGGGSFGYGKAAFYIASRAHTVVVDTMCQVGERLERRFMGSGLGEHHVIDGTPYTGRHWWGRMEEGVPEPATGDDASELARLIGLTERDGMDGLGTTVAIIAPGVRPDDDENGADITMKFVAEALVWNFWPRMVRSPGGRPTMEFEVFDRDVRVPIPDPRTHVRLRSFVEAMDRLREEDEGDQTDDPLVIDRRVDCLRPMKRLGRVTITRAPVAPPSEDGRPMPEGAEATRHGLHHVALMRNAELVVKYLRGAEPATGRIGYAGVFRCALDVDEAFRQAEPPTHDDWIPRAVPDRLDRKFVNVALDRIRDICREVAGVGLGATGNESPEEIPLGEFADFMAGLMPTFTGPGARRPRTGVIGRGRGASQSAADGGDRSWVSAPEAGGESGSADQPADAGGVGGGGATSSGADAQVPRPAIRSTGVPTVILFDEMPALAFPFEVRSSGAAVRLSAAVEVMTHDGGQVETDPPAGWSAPEPVCWIGPDDVEFRMVTVTVDAGEADGHWRVLVPLVDDAVVRADIRPEVA